jgi:hypothetical protein
LCLSYFPAFQLLGLSVFRFFSFSVFYDSHCSVSNHIS